MESFLKRIYLDFNIESGYKQEIYQRSKIKYPISKLKIFVKLTKVEKWQIILTHFH